VDDIEEVKTEKHCLETATVDCYDDDEALSGWHACLEQALDPIVECKCLGEVMNLDGVSIKGNSILASVSNDEGEEIDVSLDSIKLIKPEKYQKLWMKAYMKYVGY
jgi:hypothetical protein